MAKVFEKTSQKEAIEAISKMDAEDVAEEAFKVMVELNEALHNLAQTIQKKKFQMLSMKN